MSNCQVIPSGVKHTLRDSGVTLYIQNSLGEDLTVIKTDDPAFLTQKERQNAKISDFLLHSTQLVWLAELKDNVADFDGACDQISSALDVIRCSNHQALLKNKLIRAYIVCPGSRVPNIINMHVRDVCFKLKARSNVKSKPINPLEYLQNIRCVKRIIGTPSQDGSTVDNAPSHPLHIKCY